MRPRPPSYGATTADSLKRSRMRGRVSRAISRPAVATSTNGPKNDSNTTSQCAVEPYGVHRRGAGRREDADAEAEGAQERVADAEHLAAAERAVAEREIREREEAVEQEQRAERSTRGTRRAARRARAGRTARCAARRDRTFGWWARPRARGSGRAPAARRRGRSRGRCSCGRSPGPEWMGRRRVAVVDRWLGHDRMIPGSERAQVRPDSPARARARARRPAARRRLAADRPRGERPRGA